MARACHHVTCHPPRAPPPCPPSVKVWALCGPTELVRSLVGWRRPHAPIVRLAIEKAFPSICQEDSHSASLWVIHNIHRILEAYYKRMRDLEDRHAAYVAHHKDLIARLGQSMEKLGI
jgi:hypothetical protein